jgi:hypothetical protein
MDTHNGAATLRQKNIEFPRSRNVLGWFKKPPAREIEMDTALIALCSILLGWVFFSLVHAFDSCRIIS